MKAAVIALIAMAFGLSVANSQQTGLLLSQVRASFVLLFPKTDGGWA